LQVIALGDVRKILIRVVGAERWRILNEIKFADGVEVNCNEMLPDLLALISVQNLSYRGARDMICVLRKAIDILEKQADAAVEKRHFSLTEASSEILPASTRAMALLRLTKQRFSVEISRFGANPELYTGGRVDNAASNTRSSVREHHQDMWDGASSIKDRKPFVVAACGSRRNLVPLTASREQTRSP
jgi:hypothetical protein